MYDAIQLSVLGVRKYVRVHVYNIHLPRGVQLQCQHGLIGLSNHDFGVEFRLALDPLASSLHVSATQRVHTLPIEGLWLQTPCQV